MLYLRGVWVTPVVSIDLALDAISTLEPPAAGSGSSAAHTAGTPDTAASCINPVPPSGCTGSASVFRPHTTSCCRGERKTATVLKIELSTSCRNGSTSPGSVRARSRSSSATSGSDA